MRAAWVVVDALDAPTRSEVDALLGAIERSSGEDALSEPAAGWLEGPRRHALRREGGALRGYAVMSVGATFDVEPAFGSFDLDLAGLLEGLDRPCALLLRGDGHEAGELTARGWRVRVEIHRLRRSLPAPPPPPLPGGVVRRAFAIGSDEGRWVAQNNAAFREDRVQGAMTVERLEAKERAPWFDPAGFLLFEEAGELVASCWTKVHHYAAGPVGEIYVISVAPAAQGRGLGRIAVLEGLAHLASKGLSAAELYVRADNAAAYPLYEALGFRRDATVLELWRSPA